MKGGAIQKRSAGQCDTAHTSYSIRISTKPNPAVTCPRLSPTRRTLSMRKLLCVAPPRTLAFRNRKLCQRGVADHFSGCAAQRDVTQLPALRQARVALAAVHEQLRHLLDGSLSPVADLHGVHVVLRSQLVQRPLAADRLQRHPRLELRTVLLSCRRHRPLLSRPPTPKLTYCVVQILGTIIPGALRTCADQQVGDDDSVLAWSRRRNP